MYVCTAGVDGESTLVHLLNAKISYSEWKNDSNGFANLQQIQVFCRGKRMDSQAMGCQIRGNGSHLGDFSSSHRNGKLKTKNLPTKPSLRIP